jgi:hypothetical protein
MFQRLLHSRFAFWRRQHGVRTVKHKVMRRASARALRRH